jgi:hypothetical protein
MKAALVAAFFAAFLVLGVVAPVDAQQIEAGEPTFRIEMRDGSVYIGHIVREDDNVVVLRTLAGDELTLQRPNIVRMRRVEGELVDGAFMRYDPHRSRLMFAPTARPVHAGTGYVSVYQLFFPFVAYGITENVTLAGGVSLLPIAVQLVYIAPKVSFYDGERFGFGAGLFAGRLVGFSDVGDVGGFGVVYGMGTFGGERGAVTGGVGFGYYDGEFSGKPALMLGADRQLSNSLKLITENYVFTGSAEDPLLSAGIRFFAERLAADFSLVTTPDMWGEGGLPALPMISFAYMFGNPAR